MARRVQKGYIKNNNTNVVKNFMYNPSDFSDDIGVTFGELSSPGSSYPLFQYISGDARTISVNVYLNGKASDVADFKNFMEDFLPQSARGRFNKPPVMTFAMGSYVKKCILSKYSRNFTKFDSNLEPTEMTLSLTLTVL